MRLCINDLPKAWDNGVRLLAEFTPITRAHARSVLRTSGAGYTRALSALLVALISLPGLGTPAHAQDAAKIVGQYLKAAGGVKGLSGIQALAVAGTCTSADGRNSGTFTLYLKLPNRYYSELVAGDTRWIEGYNGKTAWTETSAGAVSTLLGQEGRQLEAAAEYYNTRLLDLKKNKLAISPASRARLGGRDVWQIEVTAANGAKRQVFFDAETHLIVEEKTTIAGVEEARLYSDYRPIGGLQLPYRIELRRGDEIYDIAAVRWEVNGVVPDPVFDFPQKAQAQLPDMKALFLKIEEHQKAIHKIRENYAGTRTEEETEYYGKAVKKVEIRQYTFFFLDGHEVSTLVKKDGKALSEEEQKKEEEKTRKRVEELQNRAAKKASKAEKDLEQGKEEKSNDNPGIEVFLRACRYVNPRHERFRGRDALVFDFEPNPQFEAHNLNEKVVQKLAGTVWIDEAALYVARLQAHFVGDVRIAGGLLANVQKGTSMVFEQAFVNNEVWLPTYEEADVGVRLLMLKGIKMSQTMRYSDYKKFNVQTLATMGKPSAGTEKAGALTPP